MKSFCQCLGATDQEQLLHLPALTSTAPATADRWRIIREAGGTRSGACVQDSLPASLHFLPSVSAVRGYHGPVQRSRTQACLLFISFLVGPSLPPLPHPHPHIPTCRRRGRALTDHADSNTLHLLCVGPNRTWSSKKRLFFFFFYFPSVHVSSRFIPGYVQ